MAVPAQVWEVGAQLVGLALSVGTLRSIEASHMPGTPCCPTPLLRSPTCVLWSA